MTTTSYTYRNNGNRVGPTFTSVTAATDWAKNNPPYSGLYKLVVVHCDGIEVLR